MENHAKPASARVNNILGAVALAATVLLVVSTFLFYREIKKQATQLVESENRFSRSGKTIGVVDNLTQAFAKLQELDDNYAAMLGTPGIDIDSADRAILTGEKNFLAALDKTERNVDTMSLSDKRLIANLARNFRMAVTNRQYLTSIRQRFSGNDLVIVPVNEEIKRLRELLSNRDDQIRELSSNGSVAVRISSDEPRDSLARLLNEEETRNTALMDIVSNLKAENATLTSRLSDLRKSQQSRVEMSRYRELETELEELSAELYLAKVDCSLVRADADKIISTSRQRKQLLTDALKVLINLSESQNSSIKQKALAKITYLETVSEKIRE